MATASVAAGELAHYLRVAEATARQRIMLDAHEPVHPTGLHRTWPNWLACEAARGNEFNAWSAGNPPEHETILPFTRLMGGPMDYTPGIFDILIERGTGRPRRPALPLSGCGCQNFQERLWSR